MSKFVFNENQERNDISEELIMIQKMTDMYSVFTITLLAESWNNKTQTVYDELFIEEGYIYTIAPDADSYTAYCDARMRAQNVSTDGEITFVCDEIPSTNITVNVLRQAVIE